MSTLVKEILQQYWENGSGQITQGVGGWNNSTYIVQYRDKKVVVRIYNTHQDTQKIKFEHHILSLLQEQKYSFQVPKPLQSLQGDTIVQVRDGSGRYACLFEYIEVDPALANSLLTQRALGEAAGELSAALSHLKYSQTPVYPPYYELQRAYPLCQEEQLVGLCADPPIELTGAQHHLQLLYETYQALVGKLEVLRDLPHQLVHGDLNRSNLLSEDGIVIAWLDFEFCTRDIRVMEAAVMISDLLGGEDEASSVEEFCTGYRLHVQLTEAEVAVIPLLMSLRKVDVFLHFTSRYLEGIDPVRVLSEQAQLLAEDVRKLQQSQAWLGDSLQKLMG